MKDTPDAPSIQPILIKDFADLKRREEALSTKHAGLAKQDVTPKALEDLPAIRVPRSSMMIDFKKASGDYDNLFNKFINTGKNRRISIDGIMLRDAILFKIDTNPLSSADYGAIEKASRMQESHLKKTGAMTNMVCIAGPEKGQQRTIDGKEIPKANRGEAGEIDLPLPNLPYDNMVLQMKNGDLFWLVKRPYQEHKGRGYEAYTFVMLHSEMFLGIVMDEGPLQKVTMTRMDYYQEVDTKYIDFLETYIKNMDGSWTMHNPAEKKFHFMNLYCCLKIVSIINCGNIEKVKHVPESKPESKSARKKRKGRKKPLPLYSHYTLRIKSAKNVCRGESADPKGPQELHRINLCRGHFKTYTEKRPLFGSIVGTFWWQPQARGNKKRGVIEKNYEL